MVQIVKKGLRKVTDGTLNARLSRVMFFYRTSLQGSTGLPPAKLMLNLKLCTHLDLLFPMIADRIEKSQVCQKATHDSKCRKCTFALGQAVYAKNFREGEK